MRRTLVGFAWFLVFLMIPAVVAAVVVPSYLDLPGDRAFEVGRSLGQTFALPSGLVALIAAVVGTKRGLLPGTRPHPR